MDWRLELVQVPVSDVDRAKRFYTEQVGFVVDHDHQVSDELRFVQLTPTGSACSIAMGTGVGDMEPGSQRGLQMVVADVHAARAELVERGAEVGDFQHFGPDGAPQPGLHPQRADYGTYLFLTDPDGNGWAVQEVRSRGASS